jgi:hypothetical protein
MINDRHLVGIVMISREMAPIIGKTVDLERSGHWYK